MAAFINANGQYLRRSADLLDYNNPYTLMVWGYCDSITGFPVVFGIQNAAGSTYDAIWVGTVATRLDWNGGNGDRAVTGLATVLNNWRHYCIVRESSTSVKLYYDGALIDTSSSTTGRTVTYNYVGNLNPEEHWNGSLAGAKAWTRALNAAEVTAERRTLLPLNPLSLYECWPMLKGMRSKGILRGRDFTEGGTLTDADGPPVSWGTQPVILAGQQSVVLSAPGVTSILTTSAVPQVTLTF